MKNKEQKKKVTFRGIGGTIGVLYCCMVCGGVHYWAL